MRETGSEQEARNAGFTSGQGETDGKRQSTQFLWYDHGAQCFLGRCPQILRSANAAGRARWRCATSRKQPHAQRDLLLFWHRANDGYPKDDHVLVTDPFEKHVTRTMDALKRNVERAGSNLDSLIHLDVFICLPHADATVMPVGKARFDAHKAQYDALNKIYSTYFSLGKAPSRACMAVEWIPGDSLIEIVGSALVVAPPTTPADK